MANATMPSMHPVERDLSSLQTRSSNCSIASVLFSIRKMPQNIFKRVLDRRQFRLAGDRLHAFHRSSSFTGFQRFQRPNRAQPALEGGGPQGHLPTFQRGGGKGGMEGTPRWQVEPPEKPHSSRNVGRRWKGRWKGDYPGLGHG